MRLAERVAIVTGSSSGLGRAIALRFATEGAVVVCCDVRAEPRPGPGSRVPTHEVIAERSLAGRFLGADLLATGSADAVIADVLDHESRVDVLMNNAGLFDGSTIIDTTDQEWQRLLDLNLGTQFRMCRATIRVMLEQVPRDDVRGRIVNMASQLGITAPPGKLTYAVAKAGVVQLTHQLAVDYGPRGILVNALAPGRIITGTSPGEPEYLTTGAVDEATALSLSRTPFSRLGRPDDVAGAAMFLASDDCTFVSGHTLAVDGGWLAY